MSGASLRAVVILVIGAVIQLLNQTILTPALPTIMATFSIGATEVQWLTSGYSLVEAVVFPLSSFLIGRFTTRQLFIGGMSLYTVGTLVAAFAPVFPTLVAGRMLQAVATGFLWPMVFTVVMVIFPKERRGTAMGVISLVFGFSPALGPTLSGLLIESLGWRALYLVICALSILIVIAAIIWLRNFGPFDRTVFDKLSVLLSSVGLFCLLYGLSTITTAPQLWLPILLIIVGIVVMAFFIRRQHTLAIPLLRISVLSVRSFTIAAFVLAVFQTVQIGTGILMPIYLQDLKGLTPLDTGLIMLPGAVLSAIPSLVSGWLFDRYGARRLAIPGVILGLLAAIGMVTYNLATPVPVIIVVYALLGIGISFTMTPLNTWGINALDNLMIQHGNAVLNTINQVVVGLGTAIIISLSATSTILYPELPALDQTMAGCTIAFGFGVFLMVGILITVLVAVRDPRPHRGTTDP